MRFAVLVTFLFLCCAAAYYAGWRRAMSARSQVAATAPARPCQPNANAMPERAAASPTKAPERPTTPPESSPPPAAEEFNPRRMTLPIAGLRRDQVQDTFNQTRGNGERRHEATDILSPLGTPVLAIEDGTVAKLFLSKPGGNTIYEFDPEGVWCFYYAHLDRYAPGLTEGMRISRGEVIGYVGTTGNAGNTPHLHLAIFRLTPDKHWWQGTAVDPWPILMNLFG